MMMIQGLLDQVERATAALSSPDEIRLAQIRMAFIYDALAAKSAATRTCPGPYWRKRPEVQEAMDALNKQGKTKRPRYDLTQTECAKHQHASLEGAFERCYVGPPRDHPLVDKDDARRTLCENCGQLLNRDRQNKVLPQAPSPPKAPDDDDDDQDPYQ